MTQKSFRLAFFASHRGSNMRSVVEACNSGYLSSKPVLLISNNADSGALEFASSQGLATRHMNAKTHPEPEALDLAIAETLRQHEIDLVLLLGYMRRFGPQSIAAFRGRILNIHPALLPKFGGPGMYGQFVHQAVLKAGERESGASVHLVDEEYDHGAVLAQEKIAVEAGDTPESLAARILEVEHQLIVQTIRRIEQGEILLP